ncbi:DUF4123 domain-containing protein [Marinobacter lipolyticus]|uniref:DUF4123 domain-containing protein n=1 Tax=Marinobacter lipolyticus TaxID=209639 RepID=UPI001BCFAF8F|nr:DUF4123 domain-containing protein [Marinobacter lipolyticus]MBS8240511.1 DUF4123 domain-containing protein [Marinobacter lipolyticus]
MGNNKTRYLVLESLNPKLLLQKLYEISESPEWLYLFSDTDWHAYREEGPILLEARQDSAGYQWALQGLKEESLSGLILESSAGQDMVADWLRARLIVRFDGQRKGLLRFYDARIWHQLSPASAPGADVIERVIYWVDEAGSKRWRITDNPKPFSMSPVATLDEHQWRAINAMSGPS